MSKELPTDSHESIKQFLDNKDFNLAIKKPNKKEMTVQEHIERHKLLHKNLDELIADFITHTTKLPSTTTVMELMKWSYEQTTNPTEIKK